MRRFLLTAQWFWFGHLGILILRVGVGVVFIYHGLPILLEGRAGWETLAAEIGPIAPLPLLIVWAAAIGIVETICGLLLILGLFARLASVILLLEMLIVFIYFLNSAPGELITLFSLKDVLLFVSMLLMGPGIYSLDQLRTTGFGRTGPVSSSEPPSASPEL